MALPALEGGELARKEAFASLRKLSEKVSELSPSSSHLVHGDEW